MLNTKKFHPLPSKAEAGKVGLNGQPFVCATIVCFAQNLIIFFSVYIIDSFSLMVYIVVVWCRYIQEAPTYWYYLTH